MVELLLELVSLAHVLSLLHHHLESQVIDVLLSCIYVTLQAFEALLPSIHVNFKNVFSLALVIGDLL